VTSARDAIQEASIPFTIERFDAQVLRPSKWFGAGKELGSVYVVRQGDELLWSVGIDFGTTSHVPFHEELHWAATNAIVIGGGDVVYFFDVHSGELRAAIPVLSLFGHLALVMDDLLLILGWTDVHAIDSQLQTRWIAKNVAVDGIVFGEVRDNAVIVSAEMDPPGGWVDVALDMRTGAELWREM